MCPWVTLDVVMSLLVQTQYMLRLGVWKRRDRISGTKLQAAEGLEAARRAGRPGAMITMSRGPAHLPIELLQPLEVNIDTKEVFPSILFL